MKLRVQLVTDDAADGVEASLNNCLAELDYIKSYSFSGPEAMVDVHIDINQAIDEGFDPAIGIEAALDACIATLDGVETWDYS